MSNHTPGPWKAVWNDDEGRIEIHMASALKCSRYCMASHVWMCEATVYSDEDTAHAREIEATADLIAAAPQLLEALEALDTLMDFSEPIASNTAITFDNAKAINAAMQQARAAIAAAKGEDQE